MLLIELAAEAQPIEWGTIIIQSLITLGVVFGGAGFWEFVKSKSQAKREDKKEQNATENQVAELITQFSTIFSDLKDIKSDLSLLQEANKATVEYREMRDKKDQEALKIQEAVIISLKGMLRERLLDNYKRCMEKGYYTKEERETYGEMFKCYEAEPFDGNGIMHQLQPKMQDLPWTKEEAERLKLLGAKKHRDLA